MSAILENCQRGDGSVEIPEAPRPYLHGIEEIAVMGQGRERLAG